jgi:two-component system, NarL family, sensor histidine kinase DesK
MSASSPLTLRAIADRRWLGVRRSWGPFGLVAPLVWVIFLVFPLANAIGHDGPPLARGLSIAAAALFVLAYVALVVAFRSGWGADHGRPMLALYTLLVAISVVLTIADRPGWAFLFTYCAAGTTLLAPASLTFPGVAACTMLAGLSSALGGAKAGATIGFVASTAGIGLLMLLVRDLRLRNEELSAARAELAHLAVSQERERFARDLHDLLGHTLSVIALKAELASRLIAGRPADAEREIDEVQRVAREALSEVREAVSGYRRPTLEGELEGARTALAAAGIQAEVQSAPLATDPAIEAALAWAVREGATNVIRHSRASWCLLRVGASASYASVEVVDDGVGGRGGANGSPSAAAPAGHGLAGLAERLEPVDGRVEAGARPEGGFRLAVSVPMTAA